MKSSFFSLSLVAILYLLTDIPLMAQSCSAPPQVDKATLIGNWQGSFTYDNQIIPLQVQLVDKDEPRQLKAITKLDALNIPKTELDAWLCKSGELHMRVDLADKRVLKLIGTPDQGKIVGRIVYYGADGEVAAREVFTMAQHTKELFR